MACGVFAPIFSFFHLLRLSSWALPLLSLACPLVCLVCSCALVGFVFSFSLSDYTQKERALRVGASSLVLLWVALFGCCFILLVLFRCQPVYIVIKF